MGALHVWQAQVRQRAEGRGCPYCTGQAVCWHNFLATQAPDVASEWDSDMNSLTPSDFTSHSNVMAGWNCSTCKHTWSARISARTAGSGCPDCAISKRAMKKKQPTLAASGPTVMKYWDAEQNAQNGSDATRLTLGSSKKVHWVCHECPMGLKHRWIASSDARHLVCTGMSRGCPVCNGKKACKCNSLQTLHPDVAAEWDHQKNNTTPDDHPAFCSKEVWWIYHKQGSWQQSLKGRSDNAWRRNQERAINCAVQPDEWHQLT